MRYQKLLSVLLAFLGILCFKFIFADYGEELSFTNSLFSVLLFVILALILLTALKTDWRKLTIAQKMIPVVCSAILILALSVGRMMENDLNLTITPAILFAIVSWTVISTLILQSVFSKLQKSAEDAAVKSHLPQEQQEYIQFFQIRVSVNVLTFLGLFLSYLIVLLAVYPGFFVYDAEDEWLQIVRRSFTTHHPLPHVLLLGGIIQLVYKLTGSYNSGMAVYFVLQMTFFSLMFTYILSSLRKEVGSLKGHIVFTLYYMLFPVISMYVLCSTKDSLFSAFLILTFFLFRQLFLHTENFFDERLNTIILMISATLAMSLRYNAVYAYILFGVFSVIYFKKKSNLQKNIFKRILILFFVPIACTFVINAALPKLLHAAPAEKQELLTVPITQLARVYHFEKEEMSQEDVALLESFLPKENLNMYTPRLSDLVKFGFNNELYKSDPGEFFSLWLRVGIRHPLIYINAWLYTSYGFWYPDAIINVYQGAERFTYTYQDSSYFGYEVEKPGVRESKIPALDEWYRRLSLELTQQKIPVVSMLFSPGFMFLLYVILIGYFLYWGKTKRVFPYLLLGLVWLTYLLGPTYLVRYVVFLWFALPILLTDFIRTFENTD